MKKFKRIFLIISGVLALLSIIFIIAGAFMGGAESVTEDFLNGRLSVEINEAFFENDEKLENMTVISVEGSRVAAQDISRVVLKGNYGEYEIDVWDESDYLIQGIENSNCIRYSLENGELKIATKNEGLINWGNSPKAKIFVPKTALPDEVALNVGAGDVQIGRENYSGISHNVNVSNDAENLMNIKCGLGDVSVEFADAFVND